MPVYQGMFHRHHAEQIVTAPLDEVWSFFSTPANLDTITPPQLRFRTVAGGEAPMRAGQLIEHRIRLHGLPMTWLTEIKVIDPPHRFIDEQRHGPYAFWSHEHRFETCPEGTRILDDITWRLPFGPLGDLVNAVWVRREIAGIFTHRSTVIAARFGVISEPHA